MARKTQEQLAETRQALIRAAAQLFSEKGFQHTQIAEIAQLAGTGISAFYKQFEDKEAVFRIIFDDIFENVHAAILAARRGMQLTSPLDLIMGIQRTYDLAFDTLHAHRQITLSVLRSGFAASDTLDDMYWQLCDRVAEEMGRDLENGITAGLLQIDRPRDFADATVGMIRQLAHRMVRDGQPTPHEAAKICTRFTLGALLLSMPPATLQQLTPLLAALQPPTGALT